jgi:hypothetical protein
MGRGLRFRRGSGGPVVPAGGVPLVGVVEIDEAEPKEKPAPRRRSRAGVSRRGGSRSKDKRAPEEPSSES